MAKGAKSECTSLAALRSTARRAYVTECQCGFTHRFRYPQSPQQAVAAILVLAPVRP